MQSLEKLIDILKTFFEKYLFPSLISVIPSALVYYLTPNDNDILTKFGKQFYLFVLFVIFFLLIELIIYIAKKILEIYSNIKYEKQEQQKLEQRVINEYQDLLDSQAPEFIELIQYFLNNNNSPIAYFDSSIPDDYEVEMLFNKKRIKIKENNFKSLNPYNLNEEIEFSKGSYVYQFKLKDDVYNNLKFIEKKKGKISKF